MSVVAVGSIFRDSSWYLDRYFAMTSALAARLAMQGRRLRYVLVEGDSRDTTWTDLQRYAAGLDACVIKREHGGPRYGSVDRPERWRQLAYCCNGVLDAAREMADLEAFIYVESDLVWRPDTMLALLAHLDTTQSQAVAPMCFTAPAGLGGPRGAFYDIWGHVKDGQMFSPAPPYHPALAGWAGGLVPVDSAGSCIVATGRAVRRPGVAFSPVDCIRGYCRTLREAGAALWLDPACEVYHP